MEEVTTSTVLSLNVIGEEQELQCYPGNPMHHSCTYVLGGAGRMLGSASVAL